MSASQSEDWGRIPTLDGLRAVSISLVMLSHGFLVGDVSTKRARAFGYLAGHLGGLGVSLFFAISGYLITTLLLRELQTTGRISLKAFYLRRAFRILPPAYAYLGILVIAGIALRPGEFTSASLFFSNYWADRTWFTEHFWSLSMEEHFYLLWPAMLAIFGVRGATRAALAAVGVIMLWRPWALSHIQLPYPALQRTDMRLDAFLFAGLLAVALHSEHLPPAYRLRAMGMLRSARFRWCATLLLAAASVAALTGSIPAVGTLLQSAIMPVFLGSVVFASGSWIFRALESAALRSVGRISYGLYLWQQVFLVAHTAPTIAVAARLFLPRLAAVFAAAIVSYYALERYARAFGRKQATHCYGTVQIPSSTKPELALGSDAPR